MLPKNIKATKEELRIHYRSGLSQKKIAEMYGVSQGYIWMTFKRLGLRSHPKGRTPRPWQQRFWNYVDKNGANGCWVWTASRHRFGYGLLVKEQSTTKKRGRHRTAHRLSWELHNGAIPKGLSVLHHCDNPPCVNPAHLFLGTQADNNRDMFAKGRNKIGRRKGNNCTIQIEAA